MTTIDYPHHRWRRAAVLPALLALAALAISLSAAGLGQAVVALWLVPGILATGLLAFLFDWLPHVPHRARGRYRDTRVILGWGLTGPMLWQNYHLIHHLYPRVPFYRYARLFDELRPELEEKGAPITRRLLTTEPR